MLDNELVVTDLLTDRSFRLNSTAVAIWRDLGAGLRAPDVAKKLNDTWRIDEDEATDVVMRFARGLYLNGLVHSVEETISVDRTSDTHSTKEQTYADRT